MAQSFAAQVGAWANKVEGAHLVILQEAAQELISETDDLLVQMVYNAPPAASGYKRTGFLRGSMQASKTAMPQLTEANPGVNVTPDFGEVILVVNSVELGETIYLGYTARYGARIHYGFSGPDKLGRTFNQPARPWVTLTAQKWVEIVERVEARVMSRLGL